MTQSISVKSKLIVPLDIRPQIDETLEGFADACNQILSVAQKEKCYNTTKLHHLVYKPVRQSTGLKANHVCQAIRRVVGNSKAAKQVHTFRPTSISLDIRTFKYVESEQAVEITLKSGRINFKLSIGGYQIALLRGQTLTSATLNKTRQGDYYINFVVEIDTPPTGKTPKIIGVDLGRRDIATTSTGIAWNGKQFQATRAKFNRVRSSLQSKRTRGSRRVLKRLSGREQRFQKNINHTISRQLVQEAKQSESAIANDKFVEAVNSGIDTVESLGSYTLGSNLENLTLTGGFSLSNGTGNALNNTIIGNDAGNFLDGLAGNDNLNGGEGNDYLFGSSGAVGERDTLTGGTQRDTFFLGNATQVFYDDANPVTAGTGDYALITDFNKGEDFIKLNGRRTDYRLDTSAAESGLPPGTAIYRNKPTGETDELIAIIQGSSGLNLNGNYFKFTGDEFYLSSLNGTNGFVINGIDAGDRLVLQPHLFSRLSMVTRNE